MFCAILYHLYNLKNIRNTHGGVLHLVKLQLQLACNFTKSNTPPWVFFMFFKLYKCYQIAQYTTYLRVCVIFYFLYDHDDDVYEYCYHWLPTDFLLLWYCQYTGTDFTFNIIFIIIIIATTLNQKTLMVPCTRILRVNFNGHSIVWRTNLFHGK